MELPVIVFIVFTVIAIGAGIVYSSRLSAKTDADDDKK